MTKPSPKPEGQRRLRRMRHSEGASLPSSCYRDPQYFEREFHYALRRAWHAVGRLDQLAGSGSHLAAELLGERIVIEREHGGLTARASTDESMRLPMEVWNGFVMVNLDTKARPLAPQIAPLTDYLAPFALAGWVRLKLLEVNADWDWKLSMEYFSRVEGLAWDRYHGVRSLAHDSLVELDTNDAWSLLYSQELEQDRPDGMLPPSPTVPRLFMRRVSAFNVYPTLHLLADARKALWLQIGAVGPQRHTLRWTLLLPRRTVEMRRTPDQLGLYCELLTSVLAEHIGGLRALLADQLSIVRRRPTQKSIQQLHRWLLQRMSTPVAAAV